MMNVYRDLTIKENDSIRKAMEIIDRVGVGLAVVESEAGKLTGVVSDGDIRRALLAGKTMDHCIESCTCRTFTSVPPETSRVEILDIMQARHLRQIPIVDSEGRFCGLHTLQAILGGCERPNWGVVMAGGKGMRLRPITDKIPKPMLKVAGRPILERILYHFISYGIHRVFIAVNYLAEIIEDYFGDGSGYGCSIEYLREQEPLGTGGALSLLPESPEHPVVVMNGDLIIDVDFARMLEFHENNNFYATMAVYAYHHEVPFGCVEVEEGRLIGLEEKPLLQKLINAGLYVLAPEAVLSIPKDTMFPITNLFENALRGCLPCGAFNIESEWHDIGRLQQLKRARGDI